MEGDEASQVPKLAAKLKELYQAALGVSSLTNRVCEALGFPPEPMQKEAAGKLSPCNLLDKRLSEVQQIVSLIEGVHTKLSLIDEVIREM
jgi:hypothetical protein